MNKKSLLRTANFALPPSLLSSVPNAVKIGSGVGAGLGLLQGAGVLESDAEKKATNVGNRLGKVLTSSTIGAGLGAGAGYGAHRYNLHKEGLEIAATTKRKNAQVLTDLETYEKANPRGIRKAAQTVQNIGQSVGQGLNSVKKEIQSVVAPTIPQRLEAKEKMQNSIPKPSIGETVSNKVSQDIENTKEAWNKAKGFVGGLLGKTSNNTNYTKYMANFQDPATLQRLIQYGSTYIPQPTAGVVSLDTSLKSKMQKKKIQMTRSSMGAKEVNSMIESGKPVGKYFSKTVRKSANFNFINNTLVGAGKMLTQPAAKAVRKAANGSGASWGTKLASMNPLGDRDAAKATLGLSKTLHGAANYLETDKAAKLAAIGVGGTALAGGGLLAAKLAHQDNENKARYSKTVRKSASFGMIPSQLISGAQKAVAGTAKRFTNLSPQINAANVGTAVGGTLGALEGSGVNETEEQRRSTGLVGRAGKVLGMTGLGAGVGRGVGSAAGYGINQKKLQDWRSNNKGMAKKGVDTTKPRSINVQDENE